MRKSLRLVAFAAAVFGISIPSANAGYVPVDSFVVNGVQRIKTGYTPAGTDRIEMKVNFSGLGSQALWCARGATATTDSMTMFAILSTKKLRADRKNNTSAAGKTTLAIGCDYLVSADYGTRACMLNGASEATMGTGTFTGDQAGSELQLFASHYDGLDNHLDNYATFRFYWCRIYDSAGNLIHWYQPARDESAEEGTAAEYGVYDFVTEEFHANAGARRFQSIGGTTDLRWNSSTEKVEYRLTAPVVGVSRVTVNVNGSAAELTNGTFWASSDDVVSYQVGEIPAGFTLAGWKDNFGATVSADKRTVTFTPAGSQEFSPVLMVPSNPSAAAGNPTELSALSYVSDGLILHWDGINNVTYGQTHDASATKWYDLTGNGLNVTLGSVASYVGGNGLQFARANGVNLGTSNKPLTAYGACEYTFEVAFDKTAETQNSSVGWKNKIWTLLCLGGDNYRLGGVGETMVGYSPNNAGSANSVAKSVTVTSALGQHTLSCAQSGGAYAIDWDGVNLGWGCVTPGSPGTGHGFNINRSWYADYGIDGIYHSVRGYKRRLSADEVAVNRAVDKVRYFGADAANVTLPDGWRFTFVDNKTNLEQRITVSVSPSGGGTVSIDDGASVDSAAFWCVRGGKLSAKLSATPAPGYIFSGWTGVDCADITIPTVNGEFGSSVKAIFVTDEDVRDIVYTWAGNADSEWESKYNWSTPEGDPVICPPQTGYAVVIPAGRTATRTSTTPVYSSLNVNGTLITTNWTTCIRAETMTIANGGLVRPACAFTADEMSNRVWIAATTLNVATGGSINANEKGYYGITSPCWIGKESTISSPYYYDAPAYGGIGGRGSAHTYGSLTAPEDPGSGYPKTTDNISKGGGAIRLDVAGALTVNGTITANGRASSYLYSGGSGGGIYITCNTIDGTGSISANGADANYDMTTTDSSYGTGGGGGRIAVHYDSVAQTSKDATCSVSFAAKGGFARCNTAYPLYTGGLGTLYFTDSRFLTLDVYRDAGWPFRGVWHSGDTLPSTLTFADGFTFNQTWLQIQQPGMTFSFLGDVNFVGANFGRLNRLELTNATVTVAGDLSVKTASLMINGGSLAVAGDVMIEDGTATKYGKGGEIFLNASPTNQPNQVGFEFNIAGVLTLDQYGALHLGCHPTSGSVPKVNVENLLVKTNGWICADQLGWGLGLGPGKGSKSGYKGAAYGGFGGDYNGVQNKNTYGDRRHPLDPGSSTPDMRGGGVVWIAANSTIEMNGKISANSNSNRINYMAGGSGGSVYLTCHKLLPSLGEIEAIGGAGGYVSTQGGGGRIAIYCDAGNTDGLSLSAAAGPCLYTPYYTKWAYPTDGTVYFNGNKGTKLILR